MKILLFMVVVTVVGFFVSLATAPFGAERGKKTDPPDDYFQAQTTLGWCTAVSTLTALIIYLCLEGQAARVGVVIITVSLWLNLGIYSYTTAFRQSALNRQRTAGAAVAEEKKQFERQHVKVQRSDCSDIAQRSEDDRRNLARGLQQMQRRMGLRD